VIVAANPAVVSPVMASIRLTALRLEIPEEDAGRVDDCEDLFMIFVFHGSMEKIKACDLTDVVHGARRSTSTAIPNFFESL
jgi:hypothetical protein